MKNKVEKKILRRYLKGEHSREDYRQIRMWFEESGPTQELDEFIFENWRNFEEKKPGEDLSFILHKIQSRINKEKKSRVSSLWYTYRKVAAVLLLPILMVTSYLLINNNQSKTTTGWAEIHSPAGARTKFMLPDGTSGWLNSESSIQYPVNFGTRQVKINGEAFFNVVKKNGRKFMVQTPAFKVTVLGTKFNVAAYPDDDYTEVVLEEGEVKIDGNNLAFSEMLSTDERFILYENKKRGEVNNVKASLYSSWKDGKLIFHDEPLSEVLKKMGRWYNAEFIMEDAELKNYIYKATFVDETLEEVMRLLAFTAPISYEIRDREKKEDGTYLIKQIIIRKNQK